MAKVAANQAVIDNLLITTQTTLNKAPHNVKQAAGFSPNLFKFGNYDQTQGFPGLPK